MMRTLSDAIGLALIFGLAFATLTLDAIGLASLVAAFLTIWSMTP